MDAVRTYLKMAIKWGVFIQAILEALQLIDSKLDGFRKVKQDEGNHATNND